MSQYEGAFCGQGLSQEAVEEGEGGKDKEETNFYFLPPKRMKMKVKHTKETVTVKPKIYSQLKIYKINSQNKSGMTPPANILN